MVAAPLARTLLLLVVATASIVSVVRAHSIKHVVVLMMENRSFDHMLGYLRANDSRIDGLTGKESNPLNTSDPHSPLITVDSNAEYHDPDPCHGVECTANQIFGFGPQVDPPPMSGFAQDSLHRLKDASVVMSMFNPRSTPVINTLAREFAVFDRWFASIPGPTMPNRMMATSASSYGACTNNNISEIVAGYPQRTIFQNLDEAGRDWHVYFSDISGTFFFKYIRELKFLSRYHMMNTFFDHAGNGTLPAFSWLEPAFFEDASHPATDQHPSHDVSAGERLIKKVYEAVRNGKAWNDTLLIVTYDEHGGFYDHVPTPMRDVPQTDGVSCTAPAFDFTRLGVRVPTIAISPWINQATVVHDPVGPTPSSKFDHTSTLATVKKLFGLPNFINKRDAWAGTYEDVFSSRSTPRTDCPRVLPSPPSLRQLQLSGGRPLSDLQLELLEMASAITGQNGLPVPMPMNEGEGRQYAMKSMARALGRDLDDASIFADHELFE